MNQIGGLYTFINFLHDERFEINQFESNQYNEVVAILENRMTNYRRRNWINFQKYFPMNVQDYSAQTYIWMFEWRVDNCRAPNFLLINPTDHSLEPYVYQSNST